MCLRHFLSWCIHAYFIVALFPHVNAPATDPLLFISKKCLNIILFTEVGLIHDFFLQILHKVRVHCKWNYVCITEGLNGKVNVSPEVQCMILEIGCIVIAPRLWFVWQRTENGIFPWRLLVVLRQQSIFQICFFIFATIVNHQKESIRAGVYSNLISYICSLFFFVHQYSSMWEFYLLDRAYNNQI